MSVRFDRFSRLAALKPSRPAPSHPETLRPPEQDDALARLFGAGIIKNRYGEHLTVRNWFSTPEFAEPSPPALELLSRTRDDSLSRRTRAALENPEKWLFLDTETTALARVTGTYAFLLGPAWCDAGGLQAEQFFMLRLAEDHSLLHHVSPRPAPRQVLVPFHDR